MPQRKEIIKEISSNVIVNTLFNHIHPSRDNSTVATFYLF